MSVPDFIGKVLPTWTRSQRAMDRSAGRGDRDFAPFYTFVNTL